MPQDIKQNTGNAKIQKQGQTTNRKYGSNPDAKTKGIPDPQDLTIKTS